jgi:hypothetical protein
MKINIEMIPHQLHRYSTVGDWWVDKEGTLRIRVSDMGNEQYSALVALHELVEVLVESIKHGSLAVPHWLVVQTDKFDEEYEAKRSKKDTSSEPGYQPDCPVYEGHMLASAVEHLAAMLLHIDYNAYQKAIADLG